MTQPLSVRSLPWPSGAEAAAHGMESDGSESGRQARGTAPPDHDTEHTEALMRMAPRIPPGPGNGPDARFMTWLGHYMPEALLALIAMQFAWDVTGGRYGTSAANTAVTVLFVAVFYSDIRYHACRLCEKCAGKTPLDPAAAVRRWRRGLWLTHQAKIILGCVAGVFVTIQAEQMIRHPLWVTLSSDAFWMMITAGIFISQWKHRLLQPWCPWCNWGDGGNEEVSPEIPDPAISR
jgi:hypothetical protein